MWRCQCSTVKCNSFFIFARGENEKIENRSDRRVKKRGKGWSSGWKGKVVCGLQSNLTNGFLNKYGSLICNQKDMRMAEATTAEEELRKCMPMAVGGHGQVRARVGEGGGTGSL